MRHMVVAVVVLAASSAFAQPKYPPTKTVDASDTYFGKVYKDPYRWLEQLQDKDVAAWFKANAQLTDDLLAKLPGRDMLAKEWTDLDKLDPARYSAIAVESGRVFYKKTLGAENVGRLYVRDGWNGKERLLFDPSTYKQGVTTTINSISVAWDGKHVVMGLTSGGAEISELRVLDVAKGTLLADTIYPSYGPTGWMKDGKAFMYDAGKTTDIKSLDFEQNRKTRVHVLGADVATDRDLLSNESNPELNIAAKEWPQASIDEANPGILVGQIGTVQNEMRLVAAPVAELGHKTVQWRSLADYSDNLVRSVAIAGNSVYAVTHTDAPKYKLVRTSFDKPDWNNPEVVLPEAADSIQYFARSKGFLFVVYSNGITGRLVKVDLATNKASDIALPVQGAVDITCPDPHSNRCIVTISSWTAPRALYDLDGNRGKLAKSVFNNDVTYPGFDQLVSEEVEVPGHDGTMIPLSIIHRKDIKLDGSSPAILEGYGAYGISYTPYFNVRHSVALHGVVVGYCHPRGGSEKGEAWYKAGYKAKKPNTWKDFISCADYLVKKGYTSPQRLGGTGTSAGGILISRAITERPDLFGAAIINVGMANALRAEFSTNGPVNTPEFGTVKDQAELAGLAEMDGLSHIVKGKAYPAVMGVGGWNDPRVPAWQPGKFVAAMQVATSSKKPVLMKVNYDDGHFTEDKSVTFKNFAGQWAFLLWQAGHPEFQPKR